MKTFYPIVNAVGYLKDQSENYWLVFIQVSLSCYRDHRSFCNLFHRAPPKAKVQSKEVPSNCSLFTYYRNQYNVTRCFERAILLYISPKEMYCQGQDLLPDLGEEISKLTDVRTPIISTILSYFINNGFDFLFAGKYCIVYCIALFCYICLLSDMSQFNFCYHSKIKP